MQTRTLVLLAVSLVTTSGLAKDKNKTILPAYVLSARTAAVIIDPTAGISIDDPRANQVARGDVERALMDWGRLKPTVSVRTADLIIVVRKGSGRLVNETIPDARQNSRPGSIGQTDNGIAGSAQHGASPNLSDDSNIGANPRDTTPQMEVGEVNDSFIVYQGGVEHPLDASPAWRYLGKDGLQPESLPAVASFRRAVADAEKAAAKHP